MMSNSPSQLAVVYSPSKISDNVLPKKSLSVMDENSFNLLISKFQEAANDLLASQ